MTATPTASSRTPITVYERDSRERISLAGSCALVFHNVVTYRELIVVLFKRDFFATYRRSYLGLAWLLVAPILSAISWIFVNAAGILQPGDVGIPYPAYVLLSTTIWAWFMGFYAAGQSTLSAGAGIITQVKYPHEIMLVKQLAQHCANSMLALGVNLAFLATMGVIASWKIFFLPLVIIPLLLLGAGIGLVTSIFLAVAPELQKVSDIAVGLMIWVTPVIYSPNFENPRLQSIIRWNPLTYLIGAVRDLIIKGHIERSPEFLLATVFSFATFLFCWHIFHVTEDKVIEKML